MHFLVLISVLKHKIYFIILKAIQRKRMSQRIMQSIHIIRRFFYSKQSLTIFNLSLKAEGKILDNFHVIENLQEFITAVFVFIK